MNHLVISAALQQQKSVGSWQFDMPPKASNNPKRIDFNDDRNIGSALLYSEGGSQQAVWTVQVMGFN